MQRVVDRVGVEVGEALDADLALEWQVAFDLVLAWPIGVAATLHQVFVKGIDVRRAVLEFRGVGQKAVQGRH